MDRAGAIRPAVLVLDAGPADGIARCVDALVAHTPVDAVLVVGGAREGADRAAALLTAAGREHELRAERGAELVAAATVAHPGSDLALISGATEVTSGWLAGLAAIAAAEPDAASVTALSSSAAFLSVPRRNLPAPLLAAHTPDQAAQLVAAAAAGGRCPPIPVALPHATLLTASALSLVGVPDAEETDTGEALAQWSARATAAGLRHLCAPGVYVGHRGELADRPRRAGEATRAAVEDAAQARGSALERALLRASVVLEPLSVTIDARCLAAERVTGTVHHVVELLGALTARDDLRVRALLPDRVGAPARGPLAAMPGLDTLAYAEHAREPVRSHVAHRPWQVETLADLALLDLAGERTVITHQDLIAYRTPAVFAGVRDWRDYRTTTRDALALAAAVCCFSDAVAADLLADDLVDPARVHIAPLGARPVHMPAPAAVRPAGLRPGRPYLLLLGTRLRHKNAGFALELLRTLRDAHGWDGDLVLAGAEVEHGSSSDEDAEWRLRHRDHAEAVIELGPVGDGEKRWLVESAAAVLFPSTYEGFGLIPFEAAAAGVPCAFAPVSAMAGLLPAETALVQPWDAVVSAARLAPLLTAGEPRERFVAALEQACAPYSWERTAAAVAGAYRAAVAAPVPPAAVLAQDLARIQRDYWLIRDRIPDAFWPLIDPAAPLLGSEQAERLADALARPEARERIERALNPPPARGRRRRR